MGQTAMFVTRRPSPLSRPACRCHTAKGSCHGNREGGSRAGGGIQSGYRGVGTAGGRRGGAGDSRHTAPVRLVRRTEPGPLYAAGGQPGLPASPVDGHGDRKSTRLNSSHEWISYAVFCLKKKKT